MTWAVLKWTLPSLVALLAAVAVFTKKTFHVENNHPRTAGDGLGGVDGH